MSARQESPSAGTHDREIAAIADQLFELVIRLRPRRPFDQARDRSREDEEQHRQRHGQMRLLITLFHEGPLTGQDLARALDVSAPTASVLAKKAFEEGWVERRRDEADSRVVWLELSPVGRERVRAHRAERVRKLEQLIAERIDLDREEVAQAVDVLTRLFTPVPPADEGNRRTEFGNPDRDQQDRIPDEGENHP
ncbi:MAG: MarR family transcriptional regulator [Thermomicrobiales bacterium]